MHLTQDFLIGAHMHCHGNMLNISQAGAVSADMHRSVTQSWLAKQFAFLFCACSCLPGCFLSRYGLTRFCFGCLHVGASSIFRPKRAVLPTVRHDLDFDCFASDVDGGMCALLVHTPTTSHSSEQPSSIAPTVRSNQADLHQNAPQADICGNDTSRPNSYAGSSFFVTR